MTKRTLALVRDRLAELTSEDLTLAVAGGDTTSTCYTGLTYCGLCEVQTVLPPLPTGHRGGC